MNTATDTRRFVVGQQLACRSMCDYDCIFRFTVLKRSDKFVTLAYFDETKRVTIRTDRDGHEYCLPLGMYSMAPVLRAGEVIA